MLSIEIAVNNYCSNAQNYLHILICVFTSFTISYISMFIYRVLRLNKVYIDTIDKNSGFECGFTPFTDSRAPFIVKFIMVALSFLSFDLEILPLFPIAFIHKISMEESNVVDFVSSMMYLLILIFILGITIYYEYKKDILEWFRHVQTCRWDAVEKKDRM